MLERLTLALVLIVHRLRPYFLSHLVLSNLDASGRLIKWTTEFSQYDLQYRPKTTIKAQALADFLVETSEDEDMGVWKIFIDGLATKKGSGVGILLVSPQADEIKMDVQLCFKASNNEVECEAVLAGLHTTKYVDVVKVILYSYS